MEREGGKKADNLGAAASSPQAKKRAMNETCSLSVKWNSAHSDCMAPIKSFP